MMNAHRVFYGDGMTTELRNAFEESRMRHSLVNSAVNAVIADATNAGKFVAVKLYDAHCKSTDAVVGDYVSVLGLAETYEGAQKLIQDFYAGPEFYNDEVRTDIRCPAGFVPPHPLYAKVADEIPSEDVPF